MIFFPESSTVLISGFIKVKSKPSFIEWVSVDGIGAAQLNAKDVHRAGTKQERNERVATRIDILISLSGEITKEVILQFWLILRLVCKPYASSCVFSSQ